MMANVTIQLKNTNINSSDYHTIFFPLWMGAGKPSTIRAGALSLRAGLPDFSQWLDVSEKADLKKQQGIKAHAALCESFSAAQMQLKHLERVALLGGDCGSDFALLSQLTERHDENIAVVWIDTHADLNTPESSPSGHFHGMVLRAALGDTTTQLAQLNPQPLQPQQVFYAGLRECDPAEREYLVRHSIPIVSVERLQQDPESLSGEIRRAGYKKVHVHLDLDVLDQTEFCSTGYPSRGGLRIETLEHTILALRAQCDIASFAVTEYAPATADAERETVLRLIRTFKD
jgi:arginase